MLGAMATATPLDFAAEIPDVDPRGVLDPESRAELERIAAALRAGQMPPPTPEEAAEIAAFCETMEQDEREHPGVADLEIAARRKYGTDFARELADLALGRHPLQLA
jgi:hypothetical protein